MASRFNRLFSLPENLYTPGSPVLISAGALLSDTQTGKVLAQLKFKNIFSKRIKAVTVSIAAYDVLGKELVGVPEYQYLDLSAERDTEFGSKIPIPMPDKVTRSICVRCTAVVFDEGIWKAPQSAHWEPLPSQTMLSEKMDNDMVNQYRRDTVLTANFEPQVDYDIWRCTCGGINRQNEENCHICSFDLSAMLSALNMETLREHREIYDADQLEKRKAEEIVAQEVRIQNAKRNKKIAIIGSLCAVILIFYSLGVNVIIPAKKYQTAISMMGNEKYSDAVQMFDILGEYKDSAERKEECISLAAEQDRLRLISQSKENMHAYFDQFGKLADGYSISLNPEDLNRVDAVEFMGIAGNVKFGAGATIKNSMIVDELMWYSNDSYSLDDYLLFVDSLDDYFEYPALAEINGKHSYAWADSEENCAVLATFVNRKIQLFWLWNVTQPGSTVPSFNVLKEMTGLRVNTL